MICPDEFLLSQYADGELQKSEADDMAAHLEVCSACRKRVADLRAENRLLVECLQSVDLCEPERGAVRSNGLALRTKIRLAAVAFGGVILIRIGLGFIEDLELPPVLEWLQPLSLSGLFNWLVNVLFYLSEERGHIMTYLVNMAGLAILVSLILVFFLAVARRAMRTGAILGLISLMLVFVVPGYSIEIRRPEKGSGSVTVASGETVDDTLVVFAQSVFVNGTITGDLFAFAQQVNIQGTVQGNVIGCGQKVDATGNVGGDIFAFAQSVQADGRIGQNLWGFGQNVTVGRNVKLDNNAMLFGSNIYVNGDVGRDVRAYSGTLDVGSKVGRDLFFRGGQILVHAPSVIGRNLDTMTQSAKQVQVDPTVTIVGKKIVEFEQSKPSQYRTSGFYIRQALRIAAAFFMGLLLYWIIPGMGRISRSTTRALLTSGGIGFLAAVATPVAAVILAITLIGLPIALLAFVLWLLGLYLAKIVVAKYVGSVILGIKTDRLSATALALIIGLVIVIVVVNLPYIGGVLNFLLTLLGLGALVIAVYRMPEWHRRAEQASEASM
jgi:anti-sigma factor RsiW/cytoskeletal protein CcmA (bactofilin family)